MNPNAALIYEFLHDLVKIGTSYFGVFNEETVKMNFSIIYELFDEMCDFGYPQQTDTATLKLYISPSTIHIAKSPDEASKIAIQATGVVSWRRTDIKYRKNEAFVDVIESVNLTVSAKGTILQADCTGQVMMRAFLTGMPECKFGLNDKVMMGKQSEGGGGRVAANVEMDDCQFHQCVKLGKFDSEKTINFIPPDGEFELMRYRITENMSVPFKVQAIVTETPPAGVEFRISIRASFPSNLFAQNVVVKIPCPLNTAGTRIKVTSGRAKYAGAENCFTWKIARFQGGEEMLLTAEAELTPLTTKKPWSRPPITLDFQVVMFAASGLIVRFLKIFEKSGYEAVKWVRYMTKAGQYQIRF